MKTNKGLSCFDLKCIGIICMTLDHIDQYIISSVNLSPLRLIGRMAAPCFLYVTVQGITHTNNRIKYALRLYISHLLISIVTFLLMRVVKKPFGSHDQFSILSTFLYVVVFVIIIERFKEASVNGLTKRRFSSVLLLIVTIVFPVAVLPITINQDVLFRGLLPNILTLPYSPVFVLMGLCWYFVKDKSKQMLILAGFSSLSLVGAILFSRLKVWLFMDYFNHKQFLMILFLPCILLYSGQRGKDSRWFFYIYYPVHIFVFMFIGQLMST